MYNDCNDPRIAAFKSLISCEDDGRYSNLEINSVLNRSAMSDVDRGLYTALVYGVIERTVTLDYIISSLSSRPLSEIDKETKTSVRLGLYQLAFMDKIPPHAAVNESVSLCPKKSRAFANAILRAFLRNGCEYTLPDKKDTAAYMSVKYSAPAELVSFFINRFGTDTAEKILECSLKKPKTSIRVNTLKTTPEALINELDGAEKSPISDEILYTSNTKDAVTDIASGKFFIQDEASFIASKVVGANPGDTVIDTCAAPGGKSFSMAIDMKNDGTLYSFDLHRNKLSLINSGAQKLGITIIRADRHDGKTPVPELIGKADRVLCDVPCSGLGVIAKKPDVKYKPLSDICKLPEVQLAILTGSAEYVKPGGVLVYSTCTLNPDENENVVDAFLESDSRYEPCEFSYGGIISSNGKATLLPHVTGTDGFFIAKMRRKDDR